MHPAFGVLIVSALTAIPAAAGQAECSARSPEHASALIELYTSEGCDSCPPADRWFSALSPQELGGRAVAIALHVDYWDRLGWKDRFGAARFTGRQYDEAARGGGAFVYTPQVIVEGRDFPQWRTGDALERAIAAANARPARAKIELAARPRGSAADVDLNVEVPAARDRSDARVVVALVQSGLASEVTAGENAGKRLKHDHVVRDWRLDIALDPTGKLTRSLQFDLPAEAGPLSIVALAENQRTGEVLQTLELPLCTAR